MFKTLTALSMVALLAAGSAAVAQDDAATTEGAASDLNMGEPVATGSGEPQVGQAYAKETSGDWTVRCLKTEDGNDPCQLYQLLLNPEGNPVVEVSLFPLPEGSQAAVGSMIVAPLGTLLTEGLTISIDEGEPRRYPFEFCNQGGCVARVGFTVEELEKLKNGNAANLRLVPVGATDEAGAMDLAISLSGFTAGFAQATVPLN